MIPRGGIDRPHPRQEVGRDEGVDACLQRGRIVLRHIAQIPVEGAVARDDVDGGAAGDRANRQRRLRRIEAALRPRPGARFGGDPADLGDDLGSGDDRVDAAPGRARMPLLPRHPGTEERAALLRVGDLHRGRLADDRQHRPSGALRQ